MLVRLKVFKGLNKIMFNNWFFLVVYMYILGKKKYGRKKEYNLLYWILCFIIFIYNVLFFICKMIFMNMIENNILFRYSF